MSPTPLTLLDKLCRPPDEAAARAAWERFVGLYTPLLVAWARAQRLQDADAADLVQEVLTRLVTALPGYRRIEGHRFRGWLFTIATNLYRDFCARRRNNPLHGAGGLSGLEGTTPPDAVAAMEEREYRLRLVRRALDVIRGDFEETTWKAFLGLAVEGRSAEDVAAELGISPNAVHKARGRVLTRLAEELAGLLD